MTSCTCSDSPPSHACTDFTDNPNSARGVADTSLPSNAYRLSPSERGLLPGTTYHFNEDGTVAWRKMISAEYLYIKKEYEEALIARYGELSKVDKTQVPDHQLLVMLGGWKRLLYLRGYTSLTQHCDYVSSDKAVSTCTITFAPNFETRMQPVTYSWTASASYINTSGDIAQGFLEATACNRAFSLCLRGFLNIGVVGKDEMGPNRMTIPSAAPSPARAQKGETPEVTPPPAAGFAAKDTLAKRCHESGISFEKVRDTSATKYRGEMSSDPATWTSFDDVPSLDAYTLLDKLEKGPVGAAKGKKG